MPYSLRDQICNKYNHLDRGSVTIIEYETYFHTIFRYLAASTL